MIAVAKAQSGQVVCYRILDRGWIDGEMVLLDGHGKRLPAGAEAVYRVFQPGCVWLNSLGQPYDVGTYWEEHRAAIANSL